MLDIDEDDKLYNELSKKMINVIYDSFPQGYPTDFLRVVNSMAFGYFSTLSAQLSKDPINKDKLTARKIAHMSNELTNFVGHMLAVEGIAHPTTTDT